MIDIFESQCIFYKPYNRACKILKSCDCTDCKFFTDKNTHKIDKKTGYVIFTGKIPDNIGRKKK